MKPLYGTFISKFNFDGDIMQQQKDYHMYMVERAIWLYGKEDVQKAVDEYDKDI